MKRLFLFSFFLFFFLSGRAQLMQKEYDKEFALQVKQIDEFIQRFNFDTTGQNFLKEYLDKNHYTNRSTFNRAIFIKTLFNQESNLDTPLAKEFISFVDSTKHPIQIDFYDNDWYALLDCDFKFNAKPQKIQLILKNQVKERKTSKWVIYSVKSDLFSQTETSDSTKIMNPMSHAVDFMSLDKSLADKKNSANYYKKNFNPDALSEFYFLIQNNILTFQKINSISYFFLQIPDWFLKVDYFNRQTYNSGWLISEIKKMKPEEKSQFKKEILNIN